MAQLTKAANEVLKFHQESGDKPAHALPLVGVNPALPGEKELDAAYTELEEAGLVETVNDTAVFVRPDGSEAVRTLYRCTPTP